MIYCPFMKGSVGMILSECHSSSEVISDSNKLMTKKNYSCKNVCFCHGMKLPSGIHVLTIKNVFINIFRFPIFHITMKWLLLKW